MNASAGAGVHNVFEVNFGLTHTPDRAKANMRAYMWDQMKDWLLKGAMAIAPLISPPPKSTLTPFEIFCATLAI